MKKFAPTFNSVTSVDYSLIGEFKLFESIYTGLPFGYIDIIDSGGDFISRFPNIQIGASVKFDFISDLNIEYNLPKFVVLDLEFGDEEVTLKGKVRIWFGHKLFIFKDTSNHAYPPMKRSELIKKVLKDQTRGFEIPVDDNNFVNSDDNGEGPEYKCCKSDWQFLTEDILPKTCNKLLPLYLYTDTNDNFNLKDFKTMFAEKSKVGIFPQQAVNGPKNASLNISSFMNDYETIANMMKISAKVNGKELIEEIRPLFYLDLPENLHFASGFKTPLNVTSKDGTPLEKFLPLDFNIALSKGSSVLTFLNDDSENNTKKLFAKSKNLDRTFSIEAKIQLTGKVQIGKPVDLFIGPGHWANGKWIVAESIIETDVESSLEELIQEIELIRPSFYGDENETTLESTATLTEVV